MQQSRLHGRIQLSLWTGKARTLNLCGGVDRLPALLVSLMPAWGPFEPWFVLYFSRWQSFGINTRARWRTGAGRVRRI
jgi:hypothetical protein